MNLNELHDSPTRKVSTNEDKNLFIKCSPKMKPGQLNHSPNRIGNTNEGSGSVNNSPLLVIGQDFKSPVKVSPKRSMFNSPEKNTSPLKITSPFKSPTKPEGVEKEGEEDKDKKYVVRESSSSFYRRIQLPERADADNIDAHLTDGILRISVPLTPLPEPKKITVKSKASKK